MIARELQDLDRRVLWHPFTQQAGWGEEDFPVIARADGTTLYDVAGNEYIDGISSLWCTVHGHRHPAIDIAIKDQLDRLAHSTMLGLTHEPAIRLAEQLVALAPGGLARVFLSRSGSPARTGCRGSSTPTAARPPARSRSRWPISGGISAASAGARASSACATAITATP